MSPIAGRRRIREPDYSVKWMAVNAVDEIRKELTDALGLQLRDDAKLEAPYDKGELVNSIVYENGRVRAKAEHALYVHEGTKPHPIYPKRPGGVLSWVGRDGARHFARRVFHPGTRPNRFFQRAMERTRREQPRITRQLLDAWLYRHRVR